MGNFLFGQEPKDRQNGTQIYSTGRGSIQIEKYIDEENLVEIEVSNNEIFAYQVKDGEETEKGTMIHDPTLKFQIQPKN